MTDIYCRCEGWPYAEYFEIKHYPSGEPLVSFDPGFPWQVISRILLRSPLVSDLMTALFFVDALVDRGIEVPELVLPFVPGARQDRLNPTGDFLFSAKSVAREINSRKFPRVIIFDPHSEVIAGMIDHCTVAHADVCVDVDFSRYCGVIAPDAGSEKRAGGVAKKLGLPLRHGWKVRDVTTGALTGFGLEHWESSDKETKPLLVVDDICDGGGTFLGLGKVIKERGLRADLYVTHGIFTQGTEKLLAAYERVFCTDSLERERPGVTVFQVCDGYFHFPPQN